MNHAGRDELFRYNKSVATFRARLLSLMYLGRYLSRRERLSSREGSGCIFEKL